MTTILMGVVAVAIIAGMIWLMRGVMRIDTGFKSTDRTST